MNCSAFLFPFIGDSKSLLYSTPFQFKFEKINKEVTSPQTDYYQWKIDGHIPTRENLNIFDTNFYYINSDGHNIGTSTEHQLHSYFSLTSDWGHICTPTSTVYTERDHNSFHIFYEFFIHRTRGDYREQIEGRRFNREDKMIYSILDCSNKVAVHRGAVSFTFQSERSIYRHQEFTFVNALNPVNEYNKKFGGKNEPLVIEKYDTSKIDDRPAMFTDSTVMFKPVDYDGPPFPQLKNTIHLPHNRHHKWSQHKIDLEH